MRLSKWSWDTLLVASIVVVAGLCAQSQQAVHAEDDAQPEGKIVRISPDPGDVKPIDTSLDPKTKIVEEPTFWIGISGRAVESPVLRTHLQLAQDMGIVVEKVVPGSPADKAGLRRHDIILRANGAGVHGMKVLQDHVHTHQAKPLELKLIRLGKEETIVVIPEEWTAEVDDLQVGQGRDRWNGLGGRSDALGKLMERLQREGGLPGGVRMFGPGVFLHGQQFDMNTLPNGVSVSITREGEGPAKITVRRGDQTWQIVGDDPESLAQLPEDLRPFVEGMLQGNAGQQGNLGFDWEAQLENLLPGGLGGLDRRLGKLPTPEEQELNQRMERMEQELRELQKRLSEE